jgi:uncharacterized protein
LGAMHLMGLALANLRSKGHEISNEELEASQIAVLLHDIGHGPFSHTLEHTLLHGVSHERLSIFIMGELNKEFEGALDLAIKIFGNSYKRKFFHQLVAGQLDIDRLDYLQRDCFFTGVSEGTIGADRIIKMLDIINNNLVVEEKGIYSVENFLSARRLMYWQVYLHKATVSAEKMMAGIIDRAKYLTQNGEEVFGSKALRLFLNDNVEFSHFQKNSIYINAFCSLDDYDIWGAIKIWVDHKDPILSYLSKELLNRKLFQIQLSNKPFDAKTLKSLSKSLCKKFNLEEKDLSYFLLKGSISNAAYIQKGEIINILSKKGKVIDVAQASDLPNIKAISKIVKKHYICWPKNVSL